MVLEPVLSQILMTYRVQPMPTSKAAKTPFKEALLN